MASLVSLSPLSTSQGKSRETSASLNSSLCLTLATDIIHSPTSLHPKDISASSEAPDKLAKKVNSLSLETNESDLDKRKEDVSDSLIVSKTLTVVPSSFKITLEPSQTSVVSKITMPDFPLAKIKEAVLRAKPPQNTAPSLSDKEIETVQIYYSHILPGIIAEGKITRIPAGTKFTYNQVEYTLPRTVELVVNDKGVLIPYMALNRQTKNKDIPLRTTFLDHLIGAGMEKRSKFAVNLTTGELCCRLTFLETEKSMNEVVLQTNYGKYHGFLPVYGSLVFDSKKKDKDDHVIKKIAVFTRYCEEGDLVAARASLFERLKTKSPKEAEKHQLHIMEMVFRALSQMHEDGMVHGDIKADNILVLLLESGLYGGALIDMGFTHPAGPKSKVSGTPGYLPPELLTAHGEHNSQPSRDIWPMGLLLFVLFWQNIKMDRTFYKESQAAANNAASALHKMKDIVRKRIEKGHTSLVDDSTLPRKSDGSIDQSSLAYIAWGCTQFDPTKRPSAKEIADKLKALREAIT